MMLTQLGLDSVRDRALIMRAMPTFAGVDEDSLALIASYARTRVFREGDVLAREGVAIEDVFAVVRGRVMVTRRGREVRLPDPAQSMVGLLPLLARDPDGFHVVAAEETLVLALPPQVVLDVLEEHFPVVRQVLRLAARTLLQRLRIVGDQQGMLGELMSALPTEEVVPPRSPGSASRVEMLLRLRESPLMRNADLDALFAILDYLSDVRFAPGEAVWRVGEVVDFTVVVDSGTLRCTMPGSTPLMLGPRAMVGRLEALSGEPARYDVIAETEVHAQRIDMSGVMSVLESHFELARKMLAAVSGALLDLPFDVLVDRVRGQKA